LCAGFFAIAARLSVCRENQLNGDPMTSPQSPPPGDSGFELSRGTVFPLIGDRATWSREHLLPILATIAAALALMAVFNPAASGKDETAQAWQVYLDLGLYIAFIVNYYANQMCGRPKRLWALAVVAFFTFALMATPVWPAWYHVFYDIIPGTQWEKSPNAVVQFAGFFFATGLCEESFKVLPLFAFALLGAALAWQSRRSKGRLGRLAAFLNRQVGLREPLDGIVFGVASGSGFFISETLGQYVPNVMSAAKYPGGQAFDGLVVLLSRGLPELVEHSAWAGLFGYFIGLSVLRPGRAILLLPLGWLSAAALHGAWDGIASVSDNGFVVMGSWLLLGMLSYALLGGAIFKAWEISPRRAAEFVQGAPAHAAIPSAAPVPGAVAAAPAEKSDWD
jgi:RsiW-degrading membrane proteinase PrsW (M82 family)